MIKDIEFPEIKEVSLAVTKKEDVVEGDHWHVYLINQSEHPITGVLITSKGYGKVKNKEVKTSIMRHFFEQIDPKSYKQVELLQPDVLKLTNEFWLSFKKKGKMYDKKYIFVKGSITEKNFTELPLMDQKGVFHP